jgi:hypothetical protein
MLVNIAPYLIIIVILLAMVVGAIGAKTRPRNEAVSTAALSERLGDCHAAV